MYLEWLLSHRRLSIGVVLTLTLIAGAGILDLRVSTDNRVFYGSQNQYFMDFLRFESQFTTNDNVIFVIHANEQISQGQFASAIRWLTEKAGTLDHAIRVDSLANYPYPIATREEIKVLPILDWACPNSGKCTKDLSAPLEDLHLINRLVSPDQKSAGIIATLSIERGAVGLIEHVQSQAREVTAEFKNQYPDYEIVFTGGVPMMAAFAEATAEDLSVLLPVSLAIMLILLIGVLASAGLAVSVLAIGLISSVIVLGCAGWIGLTINNATSITPLIILVLVITNAMHLAIHYCLGIRTTDSQEQRRAQALLSTRANLTPLVISALTSAVSLSSLALADSPPLQQLGLLSAAGTLVGCGLTLVLLPACMTLVSGSKTSRLARAIQHSMNGYARRIERKGAPALSVSLALLAASLGLIHLSIDDDFVRFFKESVEFRLQTDRATELLAGPNHIELVLSTRGNDTVFEPEFLLYLSKLTNEARSDPLVASAHSFSDVMEHLSSVVFESQLNGHMNEEELNQLFLIYEMSLGIGQTNTDFINSEQTSARASILLKESSSREIQDLESRLYRYHEANASNFDLKVTGENIPVAHLSEMNIRSMAFGIATTLAGTAILLGLWFRSARLGLVIFFAIATPVAAGFGVWGWTAGSIGLAATAIVALTIGVVVDDTTHFVYRFLDSRTRLGFSPTEAAAYATHRVGTAMISTSIVLGIGLSILVLSDFAVNSTFGSVTALIIGLALMFDLGILPRLSAWATSDPKPIQ